MIRTIILGAATALLVVGIPVAALGFSQSVDTNPPSSVTAELMQIDARQQLELNEQMRIEAHEQLGTLSPDALQQQDRTRDRVREHIETGVPEDVVPEQDQQRLREQDGAAIQTQDGEQARVQTRAGDGEPQGEPVGDGDGNRYGQTDDAHRGNAGAEPSADCPNDGDCTNDGECTGEGGAAGNSSRGKNG